MEPTAAAWSKTLCETSREPCCSQPLGKAARERIDQEFAQDVVVNRYLELYNRMISGSWP